jgi:hypothetical protein
MLKLGLGGCASACGDEFWALLYAGLYFPTIQDTANKQLSFAIFKTTVYLKFSILHAGPGAGGGAKPMACGTPVWGIVSLCYFLMDMGVGIKVMNYVLKTLEFRML